MGPSYSKEEGLTIYIDHPKIRDGRPTAHLMADSREELHEFAEMLGIKRCWYDGNRKHPHYDVHGLALASILEGFTPISSKEMLKKVKKWR